MSEGNKVISGKFNDTIYSRKIKPQPAMRAHVITHDGNNGNNGKRYSIRFERRTIPRSLMEKLERQVQRGRDKTLSGKDLYLEMAEELNKQKGYV